MLSVQSKATRDYSSIEMKLDPNGVSCFWMRERSSPGDCFSAVANTLICAFALSMVFIVFGSEPRNDMESVFGESAMLLHEKYKMALVNAAVGRQGFLRVCKAILLRFASLLSSEPNKPLN